MWPQASCASLSLLRSNSRQEAEGVVTAPGHRGTEGRQTPSRVQNDELRVTGKRSWEILPFTVSQRQRTTSDLCFSHKHTLGSRGKRVQTACNCRGDCAARDNCRPLMSLNNQDKSRSPATLKGSRESNLRLKGNPTGELDTVAPLLPPPNVPPPGLPYNGSIPPQSSDFKEH